MIVLTLLNSLQRFYSSHVLLYHSTYRIVPKNIEKKLHNVKPDQLYRQIRWLKKYFDIVTVDEFLDKRKSGYVAITFDDGYESVFTEALPVLESLETPCTVFINGSSLAGKPLWRDKIRYLINKSLVADFLEYFSENSSDATHLTENNFYDMTKNPKINSRKIDTFIDKFLERIGIPLGDMLYCIGDKSVIPFSPFLTIGSHSLNHYVMSSLSDREQEDEIRENHEVLNSLNAHMSSIFSIPFGRRKDFNETTLRFMRKYGYKGFLYSRNLINVFGKPAAGIYSRELPCAERYMVEPTFNSFQKHLFKLGLKSIGGRIWLPRNRQ